MSQPIIIRQAIATDSEAIGYLASQFSRYLRSLGDTTEFKLTAEACRRDGFGVAPAFEGIVAEHDGRVIGYLLYHLGYDSDAAQRTMHVADLYVDATSRRLGVGKALMAKAAEVARNQGAGEMIWSVFTANKIASAFYERLGARRITDVYFMRLKTSEL